MKNEDRLVLSATALQPIECTFHHCVRCIELLYISSPGSSYMHCCRAVARLS